MSFESFKNENNGVKPLSLSEMSDTEAQNELQEALAAIQRGDIVVNGERTTPAQKSEQPLVFDAEFANQNETKLGKDFQPGDDFRNRLAGQIEQLDPQKQLFKMDGELRIIDSKIAIQKQLMQGGQGNIKTLNELGEQRDRLVDAMNLITKGEKEIPLSGRDATIDASKNKERDEGFLYQ